MAKGDFVLIVTELKRRGKGENYYLYLDGELFGCVMLEILHKFKIKEGKEISSDELEVIKEENDKLTCFNKALSYISSRLKTEKQMRDYLKKNNYCNSAIELAIEKLKNYGYLNDEYYAKTFSEINSMSKGKLYLKRELYQKGVSESIINKTIGEIEGEEDACLKITQKWLRGKSLPLEKKDLQKLYRFLLSRGFEYETVRSVTYKVLNEELD